MKFKFEIKSHEGAGPVRFGMTTTEVREAIGGKYEVFDRDPDSGDHPADIFGKDCQCFVYYDNDGKAEAIELATPSEAMLGGKDLLAESFKDLFKQIKKLDPEIEFDGDGFTSTKLGIGCYAPGGEDEPEEPAEGIIVFRKGYYDYED